MFRSGYTRFHLMKFHTNCKRYNYTDTCKIKDRYKKLILNGPNQRLLRVEEVFKALLQNCLDHKLTKVMSVLVVNRINSQTGSTG